MLRVLGSFLDKSYTQFFTAKEEWLEVEKSAPNIVRDVSRSVAEDNVYTDPFFSFNLIFHGVCKAAIPDCDTILQNGPNFFTVKISKYFNIQIQELQSSECPDSLICPADHIFNMGRELQVVLDDNAKDFGLRHNIK